MRFRAPLHQICHQEICVSMQFFMFMTKQPVTRRRVDGLAKSLPSLVALKRAGLSPPRCGERNHFHTAEGEQRPAAIEIRMDAGPLGRKPPSFTEFAVPAAAWPEQTHEHQQHAITMNTMTAKALIERRNPSAPKDHTQPGSAPNNRAEGDEHSQGNVRTSTPYSDNRHQLSASQRRGCTPNTPSESGSR